MGDKSQEMSSRFLTDNLMGRALSGEQVFEGVSCPHHEASTPVRQADNGSIQTSRSPLPIGRSPAESGASHSNFLALSSERWV